ncbi:hypothetical protein HMPREF9120_02180 [Neisseria sp. oral taxon 020 str. F0370]|nr:hypothetical protein HMPREF9120_02180 [Neisseria sp. oral taxon 020 str. F0370]
MGAADAVNHGVAHIDVARSHVDFQAQGFAAVGEFAVFHAHKEVEVFFDAAVAVRAVFARFGQRAAVFAHFFGGQIIDIGFAVLNQADGVVEQLVEIIGGKTRLARPFKAQPLHVFLDGIDVFVAFFFGIGVVKAQVAQAVIHIGEAEIEADGFGVADVQVAVGLGWEAGLDGTVFAAFEVFFDDGADEVVVGELGFVEVVFFEHDGNSVGGRKAADCTRFCRGGAWMRPSENPVGAGVSDGLLAVLRARKNGTSCVVPFAVSGFQTAF